MSPRNRRRPACLVTAVVAVLLAAAPAEGQSPPSFAAIDAHDNVFRTDKGGSPHVTIAAGGHVNFVYFMGNSRHNVVFTGARPSACGISDGPPGTTAALPTQPSGPVWEGGCNFADPGTYAFVCGLHPTMTGSVTVVQTGAPAPVSPPEPVVGFNPTAAAPAASGLQVALRQRGTSVRGSVRVARSGSRVLARAFVRRRALSAGSRSTLDVQVGRRSRSSVRRGRVTFTAPLNRAARTALRRNGRLLVKLRLTVTPAEGKAYSATRTVILRPS